MKFFKLLIFSVDRLSRSKYSKVHTLSVKWARKRVISQFLVKGSFQQKTMARINVISWIECAQIQKVLRSMPYFLLNSWNDSGGDAVHFGMRADISKSRK